MNFLTAKVKVSVKMDCYDATKDICVFFKNNNGKKKMQDMERNAHITFETRNETLPVDLSHKNRTGTM